MEKERHKISEVIVYILDTSLQETFLEILLTQVAINRIPQL